MARARVGPTGLLGHRGEVDYLSRLDARDRGSSCAIRATRTRALEAWLGPASANGSGLCGDGALALPASALASPLARRGAPVARIVIAPRSPSYCRWAVWPSWSSPLIIRRARGSSRAGCDTRRKCLRPWLYPPPPGDASSARGKPPAQGHSASALCRRYTQMAPSPTAEATRLTLPARTSPAAKTPRTLVSSR
jgi:hypothetical protein